MIFTHVPTGYIFCDVREYLLPELTIEQNLDYFGINRTIGFRDSRGGKIWYRIGYIDLWKDGAGAGSETADFYGVKSSQQLKTRYGSNMLEYQTQPAVDPLPDEADLMQFLTESNEPTLWQVYDHAAQKYRLIPHMYGFIYSQNGQSTYKVRETRQLDVNRNEISGSAKSDNLNASDRVNLQGLNMRALNIRTEAEYIEFWLDEGVALPPDYVGTDPDGSRREGEGANPNYFGEDYVV